MMLQKQAILTAATDQLKAEFIGLDEIIDRIVRLVTPWYLYPELQQRPTVINLWGLTGVGKTSLVKRLVELLQFGPKFYHFDMGTNSERVDTLKTFFKELCRWGSGFPFVLALDEFQYASTKSRLGEEVDKTYSRAVWELLDTGRFQAFRSGFGGRQDLGAVITELKYLLKKGVTVENGLVTGNVAWYLKVTASASDWRDMFDGEVEVDGTDVEIRRKGKIPLRKLRFVKEDVVGEIFDSCDDLFEHRIEVRDRLLSLNGEQTIAFLEEMALHAQSRRELDCTRALVFVMGNLDEAFGFAGVMNPDIDADEFHKLTKRITVPHIKTALQSRFRNEQIARLGNNHLVYPALSKASYQRLIAKELRRVAAGACDTFGLPCDFDKTVHALLYREGVYPTQGTRPLFSTVQQLIEAPIARLPLLMAQPGTAPAKVVLSFRQRKLHFVFLDAEGNFLYRCSEAVSLQLEGLRASQNDELQAVTAVHEGGHATASIFLMGVVPEQVFSVTSEGSAAGFVLANQKERTVWNKRQIINRAAVFLAGRAAEKLVFGEGGISLGAESDLKGGTAMISRMVKKGGLGGVPFYIEVEDTMTGSAVFDTDHQYNQKVQELLLEAAALADEVLNRNKAFLLALSGYLSVHPTISRSRLRALLQKHGGIPEDAGAPEYRRKLAEALQAGGAAKLQAA